MHSKTCPVWSHLWFELFWSEKLGNLEAMGQHKGVAQFDWLWPQSKLQHASFLPQTYFEWKINADDRFGSIQIWLSKRPGIEPSPLLTSDYIWSHFGKCLESCPTFIVFSRVQTIGVSFFNKFVKWHHKLGYSVINVLKLIDITSRNASGWKLICQLHCMLPQSRVFVFVTGGCVIR